MICSLPHVNDIDMATEPLALSSDQVNTYNLNGY